MLRGCAWAAAAALPLLAQPAWALSVAEAAETKQGHAPSIFSVYEQNEREGVPNYITMQAAQMRREAKSV